MRRHVGGAAEDAHDVQRRRLRHVRHGAEHALAQNLGHIGVVHWHGHDGDAARLEVLRHVERGLLRLRGAAGRSHLGRERRGEGACAARARAAPWPPS